MADVVSEFGERDSRKVGGGLRYANITMGSEELRGKGEVWSKSYTECRWLSKAKVGTGIRQGQ